MDIRIAPLAPAAESFPLPANGNVGQEAEFALLMMAGKQTANVGAPAQFTAPAATVAEPAQPAPPIAVTVDNDVAQSLDPTSQPSLTEEPTGVQKESMGIQNLPGPVSLVHEGTHLAPTSVSNMKIRSAQPAFATDPAMPPAEVFVTDSVAPTLGETYFDDEGVDHESHVPDVGGPDGAMATALEYGHAPLITPIQTGTTDAVKAPQTPVATPVPAPAGLPGFPNTGWRVDAPLDTARNDAPQLNQSLTTGRDGNKMFAQDVAADLVSGLVGLERMPVPDQQRTNIGLIAHPEHTFLTSDPPANPPIATIAQQSTVAGRQPQLLDPPLAALKHVGPPAEFTVPVANVSPHSPTNALAKHLPHVAEIGVAAALPVSDAKSGSTAAPASLPTSLPVIAGPAQSVAARRSAFSADSLMPGTVETRSRAATADTIAGVAAWPKNAAQPPAPIALARSVSTLDLRVTVSAEEDPIGEDARGEGVALDGAGWHPTSTLSERLSLAPVAGGHPARQVAEAITRTAAPQNETELVLTPEELGTVRFTVTQQDGVVTIAISADRPDTLALLRRNADMLSADLAQSGMGDATLDFGSPGHDRHRQDERPPWEASPKSGAIEVASDRPPPPPARRPTGTGRLNIRL